MVDGGVVDGGVVDGGVVDGGVVDGGVVDEGIVEFVSTEPQSAVCSMCGAAAEPVPVDWMRETDPRRGAVWVCAGCARRHLRSIEARLDQEWW